MFTLVTDRSKFFRVKRGQSGEEIESVLSVPVSGEVFAGKIICADACFWCYTAKVGDTYRSVAKKTGVREEVLREVNASRVIYPSRRIFIPAEKS